MKILRKWSRILHRDIGYFFIGTTLIYAISGIALNHMSDWNPNYSVTIKNFNTDLNLKNSTNVKKNILILLDKVDSRKNYKKHYYPNNNKLKIFLKGGSSIVVNVNKGFGTAEYLRKRPLIFETNYLHYNPNRIWTWFSDAFAVALILFAITSFFMVKGKKGITGRGGIYTALGFLIPILFLIFFM
ncbi:PepSY-associated TM helix domain-containing protein [Lutibacter sp. TH_r2]|uniref:PepSY-associated TM helix domain-containing protein n=1 Tax=Lutibacter sp. TH_r2 TaxID=3082083 RepID=UPI00295595CD|nr:PepSY-associated TM helix domain-containing protein [Lutibacter sp. TH_r2]MDV7187250.1 PepSY-associated TM helix domain-containing protein [Lutibacter sp. TH_r2]